MNSIPCLLFEMIYFTYKLICCSKWFTIILYWVQSAFSVLYCTLMYLFVLLQKINLTVYFHGFFGQLIWTKRANTIWRVTTHQIIGLDNGFAPSRPAVFRATLLSNNCWAPQCYNTSTNELIITKIIDTFILFCRLRNFNLKRLKYQMLFGLVILY